MTAAYAVVRDNKVEVTTVHDSERGAKVNGLLMLFGIMPLDTWSDEKISQVWADCCGNVMSNPPHVAQVHIHQPQPTSELIATALRTSAFDIEADLRRTGGDTTITLLENLATALSTAEGEVEAATASLSRVVKYLEAADREEHPHKEIMLRSTALDVARTALPTPPQGGNKPGLPVTPQRGRNILPGARDES